MNPLPPPSPGAPSDSQPGQPGSIRTLTRRSLAPLALGALMLGACQAGSSASSTSSPGATAASSTGQQSPAAAEASRTAGAQGAQATIPAATASGSPSDQDEQERSATGAFAWGAGAEGRQASADAALLITDVRVGTHPEEGYDRVVVELSGPGAPGWLAPRWSQEASTPGKGEPIEVGGSHLLVVTGAGAIGAPDAEQETQMYSGPRDLSVNGQAISGVHVDPPFESEFQVVLGTSTQSYRVVALEAPTRLVIDVAHQA